MHASWGLYLFGWHPLPGWKITDLGTNVNQEYVFLPPTEPWLIESFGAVVGTAAHYPVRIALTGFFVAALKVTRHTVTTADTQASVVSLHP